MSYTENFDRFHHFFIDHRSVLLLALSKCILTNKHKFCLKKKDDGYPTTEHASVFCRKLTSFNLHKYFDQRFLSGHKHIRLQQQTFIYGLFTNVFGYCYATVLLTDYFRVNFFFFNFATVRLRLCFFFQKAKISFANVVLIIVPTKVVGFKLTKYVKYIVRDF